MEHEENNVNNDNEATSMNVYQRLEKVILESDLPDSVKSGQISRLAKIKKEPVNILFIGSTGVGKSSTINALFNMEKAKIGDMDPETESVECFQLDNLYVWDTPGIGDDIEKDRRNISQIQEKLKEKNGSGKNALIDLVVVIMDAGQRDLNSVYDCIDKILIPAMGKEAVRKRLIIGMNKADTAMSGRHWLLNINSPDVVLTEYLDKKTESIRRRIMESTGIDVEPVYYCAGYKEGNEPQMPPYNLIKLLYRIMETMPADRRIVMMDQINPKKRHWEFCDKKQNYGEKILEDLWGSIKENAQIFSDHGLNIGTWIMGAPGGLLGYIIGGAFGAVVGTVKCLI